MIEQQQKLVLSPYMEIYELVIPKDNLLRQIWGVIYICSVQTVISQ